MAYASRHFAGIHLRGSKPRFALLIAAILLIAAPPAFCLPEVVRIGAFNYYPGIFKDRDGIVKGFFVDALEDLGRREKIRFEYVYGSWSEGLERIRSGEVDVLTSVAFTPERATYMDYCSEPLLTVWGELYVRNGSPIDEITDIDGKTVAVLKEDFNRANFLTLIQGFSISCTLLELDSFEAVLKAVAEGKADAGVCSSTYGRAKQSEFGLRTTGVVFNPFDIYFTVAKGRNRELVNLLDSYMVRWRLQEDSVYNKARQKWAHGNAGMVKVVPAWLIWIMAALISVIAIGILFILLLRNRIRSATREVLSLNASLEKKVQDRTMRLQEANKELEAFAYSVSHDLRAPLRAIDGFSSHFSNTYSDKVDDEGRRLLGLVRSNVVKMDSLISGLLTLSRISQGELRVSNLDMNEIVQAALADVLPDFGEVVFEISCGKLPSARGDKVLMLQVWTNLIANAVKYSMKSERKRIEIEGRAKDAYTIFTVRDYGAGFDREYADKLFGVFQRLHSPREFEGIGIGLALVKRIIVRHGGYVWAEGDVGKGALFGFALPAGSEETAKA